MTTDVTLATDRYVLAHEKRPGLAFLLALLLGPIGLLYANAVAGAMLILIYLFAEGFATGLFLELATSPGMLNFQDLRGSAANLLDLKAKVQLAVLIVLGTVWALSVLLSFVLVLDHNRRVRTRAALFAALIETL